MSEHKSSFFTTKLDQPELARILARIDENLAFRATLQSPGADQSHSPLVPHLPALPSTHAIDHHLHEVQRSQAPFFASAGRSPNQILRKVLNLPIKLFGHKQFHFNRELVFLVDHLTRQIYALREANGYFHVLAEKIQHLVVQMQAPSAEVADLRRAVARLSAELHALQHQLASAQHEHQTTLAELSATQHQHQTTLAELSATQHQHQTTLAELSATQHQHQTTLAELASAQHGHQQWLEQLTTNDQGHQRWLEQLATDQRGQHAWVDLLQRKHQLLALDVREQLATPRQSTIPEPRIVDPSAYQARLEAMGASLKINLGCGEKPLLGYINIDYREVPDVDIVADVRHLPFEPGSLTEIMSAHLVEHFREHQLRTIILPYWYDLLISDGVLRIICPNWQAMLDQLQQGRLAVSDFKLLTFGGQDYEGDDHFAMYTPASLTALLEQAGFRKITVLATDRMNGSCPEMELVAYR